jgi:hypothetical protein
VFILKTTPMWQCPLLSTQPPFSLFFFFTLPRCFVSCSVLCSSFYRSQNRNLFLFIYLFFVRCQPSLHQLTEWVFYILLQVGHQTFFFFFRPSFQPWPTPLFFILLFPLASSHSHIDFSSIFCIAFLSFP